MTGDVEVVGEGGVETERELIEFTCTHPQIVLFVRLIGSPDPKPVNTDISIEMDSN